MNDFDQSAPCDSGKQTEVFPGVMERRYFLGSSLTGIAAVVALRAGSLTAQNTAGPPLAAAGKEKLSWDEFLKEAVPVAQRLVAEANFSVDEYLYRIGSLATRLSEIPDTQLFPYTSVSKQVFFAPSFRGTPFFIIQWRMEPGAVMPPHNHPNASVCTLGWEGEARLRNFEIVGEAPGYDAGKTFRVRETHNDLITRGRINTLSAVRDNIHFFQVGSQGARGIDISTMHGKMDQFSFLDIAEKPLDGEKRIFEATWNDRGRKA